MRTSGKNKNLSFNRGIGLTAMMLVGAVVASSQAQAAPGKGAKVMTIEQMRAEAQKARGESFLFETWCDATGSQSLSILEGAYAREEPPYPPELAKCLVSGSQDGAKYVCLCADREEAFTGTIDGSLIPELKNEDEEEDEGESEDSFEAFSDLCRNKFNEVCGPFVEPVEAYCEDERGDCRFSATGNVRNEKYNSVHAGCYCRDQRNWSIHQDLVEDFAMGVDSARDLCEVQLAGCRPSMDPIFFDFQNLDLTAYEESSITCTQEGPNRYDRCTLERDRESGDFSYECYCTGEDVSGSVLGATGSAANTMYEICELQLSHCEDFGVEEKDDDWPEEEDEDKPSLDIDDVLDALGCRAAPTSGFGFQSLLGFSALILLGGCFRRRRGK